MVGIDQIGNLLKGEKADAERKQQGNCTKVGADKAVEIVQDKVQIFEDAECAEIENQPKNEPAFGRRFGEPASDAPVDECACNQNGQSIGVIGGIEPERHGEQEQRRCSSGGEKPAGKTERQEKQHK